MNISLSLCTYNGEKYLKEQLNAIESQNLAPYEVVIKDDCSCYKTKNVLEKYQRGSKLNVRFSK